MKLLVWLVTVASASYASASDPAPWPKESAETFVTVCTTSMGSAAQYFTNVCRCSLTRAQALGTPEYLDRAVQRGDATVLARLERIQADCLDAEPAAYDRMLRVRERADCIDQGHPPDLCACMTRKFRERWPRPSLFMLPRAPTTDAQRKAERKRWGSECREEVALASRTVQRTPATHGAPATAVTSFRSGARKKFETKGHPKANGIHLSLEYPADWVLKEGERPHVVKKLVSADASGLGTTVVLIIKKAPPEIESIQEELFSDEMLKETAESQGGTLVDSGRTKIEGRTAGWFVITQNAERANTKMFAKMMTVQVIYKDSLVSLQFAVGGLGGSSGAVVSKFDAHLPLFWQISNTLIFQDQYK